MLERFRIRKQADDVQRNAAQKHRVGDTGGGLNIGWMEDGLAYVNVHTDLNGAGEVRGQVF